MNMTKFTLYILVIVLLVPSFLFALNASLVVEEDNEGVPIIPEYDPSTAITFELEESTPELHEKSLMADTAEYVFGYDDDSHGPFGGGQFIGAHDKVGIHHTLQSIPGFDADLDVISNESEMHSRRLFADASGFEILDQHRWRVEVFEVVSVAGQQRYPVMACIGSPPVSGNTAIDSTSSFAIHEIWLRRPDGPPELIRRSDEWVEPDSELE